MNIKPAHIPPEKINPFVNCKLDREKYADTLTHLINTNEDGFVLALNNEWGYGKTTFVQMWKEKLESSHKTVYFNAWETDNENDPLISLLSEFKPIIGSKRIFNNIIKHASGLTSKVLPSLLKAIARSHPTISNLEELISNLSEYGTDELAKEIDIHIKKKESLKAFKEELSSFLSKANKPLIFFIDELDRCKPDYAVKVLETVKHLFAVKKIIFVIVIDKIQLGHAIQGYYGSSNIDVENYFRRFFDIEFSLPKPEFENLCQFFYEKQNFDAIFNMEGRHRFEHLRNDKENFLAATFLLCKESNLAPRIIEKLFVQTRIACIYIKKQTTFIPELLFLLCYFKLIYPNFYKILKEKKVSFKEINEELVKCMPITNNPNSTEHLIQLEALILFLYNELIPQEHKVFFGEIEDYKNPELKKFPFSKYEPQNYSEKLNKILTDISRSRYKVAFQHINLFEKLELIEDLKI